MKLRTFDKMTTWVAAAVVAILVCGMEDWAFFRHRDGHPSLYETMINPQFFLYNLFLRNIFSFFFFLCLNLLPLKIIILIWKGKPFNISNVTNLHAIAYYLLLYDFAIIIRTFIGGVIMSALSNKNISIKWSDVYASLPTAWIWYLLAGMLVLIIAKAFKRGYNLQKEQELTI